MNNLPSLTSPVIHALGLMLVHSAWQGFLVAIFMWFFLPKMRTSRARYRLLMGGLFGLFFGSVGTFFYFLKNEKIISVVTNSGQVFQINQSNMPVLEFQNLADQLSFWLKMQIWFEANHTILVGLWLLGALFFFFKLVGGWMLTEQLKTTRTSLLSVEFEEILHELCQKMAISRPVRLLESGLAAVPMTLGWLKPVILLPVGLVNYLSISEVEAVLAHELAHIARRDWLFNILQSFVEVAFYFHPAVWWISGKIRLERENVADDFALATLQNEPIEYVKTLVRVQEVAVSTPKMGLALAFFEKRNLLSRVHRILFHQPNHKNSAMEKMIATGMLIAIVACFSLRADSTAPIVERFTAVISQPSSLFELPKKDSIPPKKLQGSGQITLIDDEKAVKIDYQNGEIVDLQINGVQIPKADFGKYEQFVAESLADMPPPPNPPDGHFDDFEFPEPPPSPPTPEDDMRGNGMFNFSDENAQNNLQLVGTISLDALSEMKSRDQNDRTHLKIQQNGETHELIFEKNGAAFLDGKPIKNGENQAIFSKNDQNDFFGLIDDQVFGLKNGVLSWNPADPSIRTNLETQITIARAENEQQEREYRQQEREYRQREREYRHQERTADADSRAADADSRTARADSRVSDRDSRTFSTTRRGAGQETRMIEKNVVKVVDNGDETGWLLDQLRQDNFNLKHYSVELTSKKLKINGKKQSDDRQKLYFSRYCKEGGGSATSTFSCSFSEN